MATLAEAEGTGKTKEEKKRRDKKIMKNFTRANKQDFFILNSRDIKLSDLYPGELFNKKEDKPSGDNSD